MSQSIARRAELVAKKPRPSGTVEAEILAHKQLKTCGRNSNRDCWRGTKQCTSATADASRAYCDVYAQLRGELAMAQEITTLSKVIESVKIEVKDRDDIVVSGKQDEIISQLTGYKKDTVELLKPSLLATVAALITHILWAGHGMIVNGSIAAKRDENLEKQRIRRQLDKAGNLKNAAVADATRKQQLTEAETLRQEQEAVRAVTAEKKVQATSAKAPLHERPLYMQVEAFIAEKCAVSSGLRGFLGAMHDEYSIWAQHNKCQQVPVGRFKEIVEQVDFPVSSEGRVSGLALKTGASSA